MILYLFLNSILILKLIVYVFLKLLLFNSLFTKVLLLFSLLFSVYLLYKYPRTRFNILSKQRRYKLQRISKYGIYTTMQHVYNILVILLFILLSLTVVFYLRYLNRDRILDLREKFTLIKELVFEKPLLECFLDISIFALFFVVYIILLMRLIKYFKFHIIKRHLYHIGGGDIADKDHWYALKFLAFFHKICLNYYSTTLFIESFYEKCYFIFKDKDYGPNFENLPWQEQNVIQNKPPVDPSHFLIKYPLLWDLCWHFVTKWHYIFIILLIFYDLIFNNFQLSLVFMFLPWIYFYDMYVRISKFLKDLDWSNDECIHSILYCHYMEIWDSKTLIIDGKFYDYDHIKEIYSKYILKGFIRY